MWLERSNHLRLIGQSAEALRVLDEAIRTGGDAIEAGSMRILERNRAILLRETGMPDESVRLLTELAKDAKGGEKLEIFESLSFSKAVLGDYPGAAEVIRQALEVAKGPYAAKKPRLEAAITVMISGGESVDALLKLGRPEANDPATIVAAGSGWSNALQSVKELPDDAIKEILRICDTPTNRRLSLSAIAPEANCVDSCT